MSNTSPQEALCANKHMSKIFGRVEVGPDGTLKRVLVVETDLELDGAEPGYSDADVNQLAGKAARALGDLYDRADIVPASLS